jgi:RND family efflux transporter MFP subunit
MEFLMDSQVTAPPTKARPHSLDQPAHGQAGHSGNGQSAGHDQIDLNVPHPKPAWIGIAGVSAFLIVAALLVIGLLPRWRTGKELAANADAELNAPVPVTVVTAKRADATIDVVLPGTLRPWQEVSIFSRSTGYLKDFFVDISNQVKAGQVMAEISTPEVDQQLRAAQATLVLQKAAAAKAKTDLDFAEMTDKRYESLRGTSGVTQQELDQFKAAYNSAVATYHQAEAQIGVAEANVKQLSEQQSFEQIIAPFSGVVTGRTYDRGSFIIANPTAADISPMFKIAENDVLRAFVSVPQNYSLTIQKGMKVTVTAREQPGREFPGTVLGTTNYLDPNVRTLLTEVRIENKDLALLPGMYVQGTFHVTRENPPWIIPAAALVNNSEGTRLAIVRDNKVHFQTVTVGVDFGNAIEITGGLTGDEQIVGNPGERIIEGAEVKVATDKPEAAS